MQIKKIKTIIFYLLLLPFLSGCLQSTTSLFGPSVTVAKSGSIYQGGLSFATNKLVTKGLGQPPIEFVENLIFKKSNKDHTDITINEKNDSKVIASLVNEKNDNQKHTEFINAVKKMLK